MSRAESEAARAEGNASFRKGRWTEAAAAYTRAIEADPSDSLPYANRAAAWLKLGRYAAAEADATRALERGGGVKASFRRAAARRAQGQLGAAGEDLRAVLAAEPNNAAAAAELEEVEREIRGARDVAEVKAAPVPAPPAVPAAEAKPAPAAPPAEPAASSSTKPALPPAEPTPTPQRNTSLLDASFGKPPPTLLPEPAPSPSPAAPTPAAPTPAAPASFASLRQARSRPAYAGGPAPPLLSTTVAMDEAAARATGFLRKKPQAPAPTPATPAAPSAPAPPDPASTAPGAGLALLRALAPLPPPQAHAYLRHYAPANVARITAPVLEPDSLGVLLSALGAGTPADAEWTRDVLAGLRATPRWRINAAMLSSAERAAGERAWALAGGQGPLV
ncbi:hypothetical protein Q8F55_006564 [Vanrija albida]|uniref:RNA-polymerase II-associated protein 3-like C-terminal domain-containing protein n=1 Tax=Vanrija albida TaxID=181172 RepID=A0ABR3PXM9_9TREE